MSATGIIVTPNSEVSTKRDAAAVMTVTHAATPAKIAIEASAHGVRLDIVNDLRQAIGLGKEGKEDKEKQAQAKEKSESTNGTNTDKNNQTEKKNLLAQIPLGQQNPLFNCVVKIESKCKYTPLLLLGRNRLYIK